VDLATPLTGLGTPAQLISPPVIPGLEAAKPEQISPLYWELHTTHRDEAERVFRLDDQAFPRP
jgi:hypothetical protein